MIVCRRVAGVDGDGFAESGDSLVMAALHGEQEADLIANVGRAGLSLRSLLERGERAGCVAPGLESLALRTPWRGRHLPEGKRPRGDDETKRSELHR